MPESMLNMPGPPQFLRVSEITADSVILTATMLDREASRLDAQNIHITERGIKLYPHQTTYRAIEEQGRARRARSRLHSRQANGGLARTAFRRQAISDIRLSQGRLTKDPRGADE